MISMVRVVYIVLALMIPGGIFFMGLAWAGRKMWGRLKIERPRLPLRNAAGMLICSAADWERCARDAYPARYFLTISFPKALRRLRLALKRPFRLVPPSERVMEASFDVLVRWVGGPGGWVLQTPPNNYDDDPIVAERWTRGAELRSLYLWWTTERHRSRVEAEFEGDPWGIHQLWEYDQFMLNRLVNARVAMTN